jgi:putative ABC transport system permease protein
VGVVLALWGSSVLSATFLPRTERASVLTDSRTLLFAAAITLGVGVLTGLAPIAQVTRRNLSGDLKAGAREGTNQRTPLRSTLLLAQGALSVVLLVGAGLFVRSLRNVRQVPIGFDARAVLDVSLEMRDVQLDSAGTVALLRRLVDAAAEMPEVAHVTLHESTPFAGMSSWPIFVDGIDSTAALGEFHFNAVSADYFKTMGTRIIRGRGIEPGDISGAPRAAVVGEKMAVALWPGHDAIGRCFRVGLKPDGVPCTYVVGIAEDIHSQSIEAEPRLFYYYMSAW